MNFELVITFSRQILLSIGASAVTAGYMTNDQLTGIVGALISLVTIGYGLYAKQKAVEVQKALQVEVKEVKKELKEEKSNHGTAASPGYSTPGY